MLLPLPHVTTSTTSYTPNTFTSAATVAVGSITAAFATVTDALPLSHSNRDTVILLSSIWV